MDLAYRALEWLAAALIQQQITIILPPPENINWLRQFAYTQV